VQNSSNLDRLKDAERAWHDASYRAHAAYAYPETVEDFRRIFFKLHIAPFCEGGWGWWGDARQEMLDIIGDVRGLQVLDYGCGYGALGMYLSLCGAEVWGFDFSQPAIATADQAAKRYGLSAQFALMDATELTYPTDTFDLVVGFGILHHVIKYPQAGAELFRVLKPAGRAVFHETLWDNPLINLARRLTTEHSDAGDAELTESAVREFCREFSSLRFEKRHLFYMLKRLAKLPAQEWNGQLKPRPFWRSVKAMDERILRLTPLRRYCGEVIVIAVK